MGTTNNFDTDAATTVVAADTLPIISTLTGRGATATVLQMLAGLGGVVNTTATSLTITAALHAGKTVTLSSAVPIAVVLPQATGTGLTYKFQVQVVATGTAHTIAVANATDVMQGIAYALTTSSDNVIGYHTTATSDTISLNGTTKGGVVGDIIEITDVKTGFFSVKLFTAPTGSYATPFSAAVP